MRTVWLLAAAALLATVSAEEKDRPVSRVIALLRNIQKELIEEAKKDEETFDKIDCWCKVNRKEKQGAVAEANRRINEQEATIQEAAAQKASMEVQQKNLEEDIAEMVQQLKERDELKRGESGEAADAQRDLLQSIQQLKNAIKVLSSQSGGKTGFLQARRVLRHVMWKHGDVLQMNTRTQMNSFLQAPGNYQSYQSRATGIVGVLQQMLEDMEQQLADTKGGEEDAMKKFGAWKDAKEAELKAAKETLDTVKSNLAAASELLMNTKKAHEDTRAAQDADQKFLMDLELRCQQTDNEWKERTKTRNEEIKAVSETIKILADDDAHDLFNKTMNKENAPVSTAFLQTGRRSTKAKVAAMLTAVAKRTGSTQLAALAVEMQLKVFTKVIDAMKKMIGDLKTENKEDTKMRDWCKTTLFETEKTTTETNRKREDLETNISDLTNQIETLSQEIKDHEATIAELQVQLKKAGENRDAENAEFKEMSTDQQNTQLVLKKAITRMEKFYKEFAQKEEGLMQEAPEPGAQVEAMPEGFNKYDKNAGAQGVLSLLRNLVDESKKFVKEATDAENDAQAAYEEFVSTTNDSIEANSSSIRDKTEQRADAEQSKADAEADLKATMDELEQLAAKTAELHRSCDFLLKNFEIRQQARYDQIKALQNAIGALNGADLE